MELVDLALLHGVAAIFRCHTEFIRFFSCGVDRRPPCNCGHNNVVISNDEIDDDDDDDDDDIGEELTRDDIGVVLERLGMRCGEVGSEGKGVVGELLEEKEASEWELKEAFYVFDRNGDDFITADELWNVMRRLGFEEGRKLDDCQRMINKFDEDGDGKISFLEFKRLLENTT